jgi:hypothetical protein
MNSSLESSLNSSLNSSRNSSHSTVTKNPAALSSCAAASDCGAVLVREAGVPFRPTMGNVDPFAEWISLMEVVQMLCPVWPVRDRPMLGKEWKL